MVSMRVAAAELLSSCDLRHRIDAQGQRYGKVIAYKHSELRAVELLDELCGTTNKYTLGKRKDAASGTDKPAWILVQGESSITIDGSVSLGGNEQKAYSRQLESYCGGILEDYDEEVVELLKSDRFEDEGVPKVLCAEVVKHCKVEELQEWEAKQQPVSSQDAAIDGNNAASAQSNSGGNEEEL